MIRVELESMGEVNKFFINPLSRIDESQTLGNSNVWFLCLQEPEIGLLIIDRSFSAIAFYFTDYQDQSWFIE